jgi:putative exosortase-associated protein (TIGR04073 family)
MKRILIALLVCVLAVSAAYAADDVEKDTAYRIRRGVNNLTLGWLEIPRNIVYEDAKTPYAGFFYGLVKGPLMTVWRTGAGTVDLIAAGQTGKGLYMDQIPEFATDAKWFPEEKAEKPKLKKKTAKTLKPAAKKKKKVKTEAEKAEAKAKREARKAKKAAKEATK